MLAGLARCPPGMYGGKECGVPEMLLGAITRISLCEGERKAVHPTSPFKTNGFLCQCEADGWGGP